MVYFKFAKRVDIKCSYHTPKNGEVIDVLISLIVVLILQYVSISKHHVVHLKYVLFLSVNYTSIKLGKNKNTEMSAHAHTHTHTHTHKVWTS